MDSALGRLYQADLLKPSIGRSMSELRHHLGRRAAAELIGTAMLLPAVAGSGVAAERLAAGNSGLALLANSRMLTRSIYRLRLIAERYIDDSKHELCAHRVQGRPNESKRWSER